MMKFEWDTGKAAANLRKHGVSFNEAGSVFPDHSAALHIYHPGTIRIISACSVTRSEWKLDE